MTPGIGLGVKQMMQKKEITIASCIALIVFSMAAVEMAKAIPIPSEGTLQDSKQTGAWNWNVKATVTGHWAWIPPLHKYAFDEATYDGSRFIGTNIAAWEYLKIWYGHDGSNFTDQVYQPAQTIEDVESGSFHHIYVRAEAGFMSIIPPTWWTATTDWAQLSI